VPPVTPQVEPYHRFTIAGTLHFRDGAACVGDTDLSKRIAHEQQFAEIERPGGEPWRCHSVRVVVEYVES
jgi:hypothetical protein